MAKKPKAPKDPNKVGRIKQIRQSYTMTKQSDPRIGQVLLGTFVLAALAGFALMLLAFRSGLVFPIVFGVLVGTLAVLSSSAAAPSAPRSPRSRASPGPPPLPSAC